MRSATSVPTGSNLGNPKQPKPGSADRLRSPEVADLTRTLEEVKVKVNICGSDKRRRRQARRVTAQPSTSTGFEKGIDGPNTGRLDGNSDKDSAEGNITTPVQRSVAKAGQPEAPPSREKAPEPSTKRIRTPGSTPDHNLRVTK
ncbi:hypothetical protein JTB14_001140 [Gonioctena quinquepunctata]|nr:hypothetical protein JTB14_001140 [Gonioctena quinquepunctata]